MDFFRKNKGVTFALLGILALVVVIVVVLKVGAPPKKEVETDAEGNEIVHESSGEIPPAVNAEPGTDLFLMQMQPTLESNYGKAPEGFIWTTTGELLSTGDKSLSAEDVMYGYLRSASLLDFSGVQKLSRNSSVQKTYNNFFSNVAAANLSYEESFVRKMYKEVLLSMEVKKIVNSAVFANNKVVFTVEVEMLDLTNKDFWEKDKDEVFKNMRVYSDKDATQQENYVYDYILKAYQTRGDEIRRTVLMDFTVEKFPDLNSGWLVSSDIELDNAAKYKDGKAFARYLREQYTQWYLEQVQKEAEEKQKQVENNN